MRWEFGFFGSSPTHTHTHTTFDIWFFFIGRTPESFRRSGQYTHTHTRNIIIRVYNLSARNPCVYVATSPLCPLIPPPLLPIPTVEQNLAKDF
jgi:hypothetical protein